MCKLVLIIIAIIVIALVVTKVNKMWWSNCRASWVSFRMGGDAFIPGGNCIIWRLGELGGFHCLFLYTLSLYLFFCVFLFPPLSFLALYNYFFGWLAFVGDGMSDFLVSLTLVLPRNTVLIIIVIVIIAVVVTLVNKKWSLEFVHICAASLEWGFGRGEHTTGRLNIQQQQTHQYNTRVCSMEAVAGKQRRRRRERGGGFLFIFFCAITCGDNLFLL